MIPVTLIGGYLGAGKTTLINTLLRHADGQRIAVLVNEFGALPIDADLIEAEGDQLISISGGCVCCSFGDDLAGGLRDLSALDPAPDHIVIEASGVALPGSVMATVSLVDGVAANATVVLADAATTTALLADPFLSDTVERQLTDADRIVVTKTDVAEHAVTRAVMSTLSQRWPEAEIVASDQGPAATILLAPSAPKTPVTVPHAVDDIHDSFELELPLLTQTGDLEAALAGLGSSLLRAKGFARTTQGDCYVVQAVGQTIEIAPGADQGPARLVVITRKGAIGKTDLDARFADLAGPTAENTTQVQR